MNQEESKKKQIIAGTWDRNTAIWTLYSYGWPQSLLAKRFNVSRQRIHQIINRFKKYPVNRVGWFTKLLRKMGAKRNLTKQSDKDILTKRKVIR